GFSTTDMQRTRFTAGPCPVIRSDRGHPSHWISRIGPIRDDSKQLKLFILMRLFRRIRRDETILRWDETILGFWRRTAETAHGYQDTQQQRRKAPTRTNWRQSNADHEPHPRLCLCGGWYFNGWFGSNRFAWDRNLLLQWLASRGGAAAYLRRCCALVAR